MSDRPIRDLLIAIGHAVVGAIRGTRLFWDSIDDMTARFIGYADRLDPGCDHETCPDTVPAWMEEGR